MFDISLLNPKIVGHVMQNVIPEYVKNDPAHRVDHAMYVIDRSIRFSQQEDEEVNSAFIAAAYHDCKKYLDSGHHAVLGAMAFYGDRKLRDILEEAGLLYTSYSIVEAIEDHPASCDHIPRNMLGKIISTADRNTSVETFLKRVWAYRSPNMNDPASVRNTIEGSYKHAVEKYGRGGYAINKNYVFDAEYDEFLVKIQALTDDKDAFIDALTSANAFVWGKGAIDRDGNWVR